MNSVTGAILVLAAVVALSNHSGWEVLSLPLGLVGTSYIIHDWVQAARRPSRKDAGERDA